MASLRQIRRRMRSVENIHDITKAMEMIAGFRYKKAEGRLHKAKPYFTEMQKLVANLSSAAVANGEDSAIMSNPFFQKRNVRAKALIVMTADKGLCGAYNTNLLKMASEWQAQNGGFQASFVPVGKVASEFFRRRGLPVLFSYLEKGLADPALARKITEDLKKDFLSGKVDSVEVLYTVHRLGGTGKNQIEPFLALDYLLKGGEAKSTAGIDYIYEPDLNHVYVPLLERFLEGKLYLCLLESLASEYGARMVAMKQATDNAEEVLDNLTLLRNKTRQTSITRELLEIVSGANALV
ncbi:MAG: ATP synthase F1 subunit gamma [Candidatus Omnitrophota bacterium]